MPLDKSYFDLILVLSALLALLSIPLKNATKKDVFRLIIALMVCFSLGWSPVVSFAADRRGVVLHVEGDSVVIRSTGPLPYERVVDPSSFDDIEVGDSVRIKYREVEEESDELHWYVVAISRD